MPVLTVKTVIMLAFCRLISTERVKSPMFFTCPVRALYKYIILSNQYLFTVNYIQSGFKAIDLSAFKPVLYKASGYIIYIDKR